MQSVPKFEEMLVNSGIKLLKYYLDISKSEQARRLADRKRDPLKQWKVSPVDEVALKHWKAYSAARADDKRLARLNLIRDILSRLHYAGKKRKLVQPNPKITFEFNPECLASGALAK